MPLTIRPAVQSDRTAIRDIYASLNRPARRIRISEYLVAVKGDHILGCAAVRVFSGGGYLYGLAVQRDSQHSGVGTALTRARMERIRNGGGDQAVVMAMFWNVGFFQKLGFVIIGKQQLSPAIRRLADFRNPVYKRSAVLFARVSA